MDKRAWRKQLSRVMMGMICLLCSKFAQTQQNSISPGERTYSSASDPASIPSAFPPGVNESGTGPLAEQTVPATSSTANSTTIYEKFAGEADPRSTWITRAPDFAGVRSVGRTVGTEVFSPNGGASWVAGANSFKLDRQPGGIWRTTPATGVSLGTTSKLAGLSSLPFSAPGTRYSTGLTPKGAEMIKGAGLSSPFASHPSFGSGFHRSTSTFINRAGTFGSFARGKGADNTQNAPTPEVRTNPTLSDTIGAGTSENPAGTSH